jgi:peptidoglycan/LPS O-acetylase OafA/YrhL
LSWSLTTQLRKPELSALTGIRFYAALFVFLSHVVIIPGMETMGGGRLIFNAGVVGVSFFFVLSGFILTYNYADLFQPGISKTNYKRFIWDRWSKIYPVHLLTLLLVLPIQVYSPNLPLDWRAVPAHLVLMQCWWPLTAPDFHHYLNVPSWSISCEWFFYLLAPVAILGAFTRRLRWIPVGVGAIYIGLMGVILSHDHSDYSRLYFVSWFAPSRVVEFVVGIFLARRYLTKPRTTGSSLAIWTQIAGLGLIVMGAVCRERAPWPLWGGILYMPGSALLIVGLANGRTFLTEHLSTRWLERLGMASFSFYMIHAVFLRAVKGVFLRLNWEVRSWSVFVTVVMSMFVLAQIIALIIFEFYERPVQRWLRSCLHPLAPVLAPVPVRPGVAA